MIFFNVNIFGIILAVIASMIVGMLWYSPLLFGKKWMALVGMTPDMTPEAKKKANKAYMMMLIPAIIMAYVLGLFLKNMFVGSFSQALNVGIFLWLGFVATTGASEYIFYTQPKPWALYLINIGYQLVNMLVGSAILYYFIYIFHHS